MNKEKQIQNKVTHLDMEVEKLTRAIANGLANASHFVFIPSHRTLSLRDYMSSLYNAEADAERLLTLLRRSINTIDKIRERKEKKK